MHEPTYREVMSDEKETNLKRLCFSRYATLLSSPGSLRGHVNVPFSGGVSLRDH